MGLRLLGEDPATLRNPGADHQCPPLLSGHAHALASQHLDDDGIPVGAKVTRVLVPLPDLELHRPDPVEKGGVIDRLEHRGESRVLAFLSIEPGVRIDVVPTLAMLVALVLHGPKAARPQLVSPHPGPDPPAG